MKSTFFAPFLIGLYFLSSSFCLKAQLSYPNLVKVGTDAPDFKLQVYAQGTGKPQLRTPQSYAGKWLILDFWTRGCLTCIQSFPKVEQLRKTMAGKVELLLVGRNDVRFNAGIEKIYQRFREDWFLKMDIAYDTTIFKRYGITKTPVMVVIDPKGKVAYAKVSPNDMGAKLLDQLMNGGQAPIVEAAVVETRPLRYRHDSLSKVPHQSSLLPWKLGDPQAYRPELVQPLETDSFYTAPMDLAGLYRMAYFGRANWAPMDPLAGFTWEKSILEMADTSAFVSDYKKAIGQYSYALKMNPEQRHKAQMIQALQADLSIWFPYRVSIETRAMPVLKLVLLPKTDREKFRSKAEKVVIKGSPIGYNFERAPMQRVMGVLRNYLDNQVIIDGTGIDFPIDLELDANLLEFRSISKALRPLGMDLIRTTHPLQVLVIRDR